MQIITEKYRPNRLDDTVISAELKGYFKRLIESDNLLNNSFLFFGPSSSGKTTVARIFANSINSEIVELNAATTNGIDNIRDIEDICRYTPIGKKYRCIIIDEAHMLTKAAWNGLLKVLEDNTTTIFILCTTEPGRILDTIKSRAVPVRFNPPDTETIYHKLKYIANNENIKLGAGDIRSIARGCNGNIRSAINMLVNNENNENNENNVLQLIKSMLNLDASSARKIINNEKDIQNLITNTMSEVLDRLFNRYESNNENNEKDSDYIQLLLEHLLTELNNIIMHECYDLKLTLMTVVYNFITEHRRSNDRW